MGDEEAAAAEAAAEPAKKGRGKLMIILLVVGLLVVVGGGAAAYFFLFAEGGGKESAEQQQAKAAEEKIKAATLGLTMQMDPFVVNLAGSTSRYLKIIMVLQLSAPEVAQEITNRLPQIKDSIITVLSAKSSEELLTVQGKYDLKVDLTRRINSNLTLGVVQELFFTEFVVQ